MNIPELWTSIFTGSTQGAFAIGCGLTALVMLLLLWLVFKPLERVFERKRETPQILSREVAEGVLSKLWERATIKVTPSSDMGIFLQKQIDAIKASIASLGD